jgi:hypothetical protein
MIDPRISPALAALALLISLIAGAPSRALMGRWTRFAMEALMVLVLLACVSVIVLRTMGR